jgi:hypothetical protein
MLDDDALAAWDALWFDLESYDHHEITLPNASSRTPTAPNMILPPETRQGALKVPYRKTNPNNGKSTLMSPPYEVQVVKIALGADVYDTLRAGTVNGKRGAARHVWAVWTAQGLDLTERQSADPKSAGRANGVETVA